MASSDRPSRRAPPSGPPRLGLHGWVSTAESPQLGLHSWSPAGKASAGAPPWAPARRGPRTSSSPDTVFSGRRVLRTPSRPDAEFPGYRGTPHATPPTGARTGSPSVPVARLLACAPESAEPPQGSPVGSPAAPLQALRPVDSHPLSRPSRPLHGPPNGPPLRRRPPARLHRWQRFSVGLRGGALRPPRHSPGAPRRWLDRGPAAGSDRQLRGTPGHRARDARRRLADQDPLGRRPRSAPRLRAAEPPRPGAGGVPRRPGAAGWRGGGDLPGLPPAGRQRMDDPRRRSHRPRAAGCHGDHRPPARGHAHQAGAELRPGGPDPGLGQRRHPLGRGPDAEEPDGAPGGARRHDGGPPAGLPGHHPRLHRQHSDRGQPDAARRRLGRDAQVRRRRRRHRDRPCTRSRFRTGTRRSRRSQPTRS